MPGRSTLTRCRTNCEESSSSFTTMRTFAKFSNVNNDHAVRYSHKYDEIVTSNSALFQWRRRRSMQPSARHCPIFPGCNIARMLVTRNQTCPPPRTILSGTFVTFSDCQVSRKCSSDEDKGKSRSHKTSWSLVLNWIIVTPFRRRRSEHDGDFSNNETKADAAVSVTKRWVSDVDGNPASQLQ